MASHMTDAEYKSGIAAVWRATYIMGIVTVIEVFAAIYLGPHLPKVLMNSLYAIASLIKAFFIIGEFMHLRYEKRAFMISLGVPLIFLVWAIIAFATEGHSWFLMNHPQ